MRHRFAVLAALIATRFAMADVLSMVQAQTATQHAEVTLSSGEVITGELLRQDAEGIVLKHPILGDVALRPDQFKEVKEIAAPAPLSPWSSYLNTSVSGVQSTNNTIDLRLAGGVLYKEDGWLAQLDAQWYYRANNGQAQDNNILVTQLIEREMGESPWTLFEKAQFEYDQFQSWKDRYSIFGGAGYRLCDEKPLELTPRVGLGATREEGSSDRWYPSLMIAVDGLWTINDDQRVKFGGQYVPDVANFQEFFFFNAFADFVWDIPNTEHLSFVAGIRDEYNSSATDGTAKNELRYYAGIQFTF